MKLNEKNLTASLDKVEAAIKDLKSNLVKEEYQTNKVIELLGKTWNFNVANWHDLKFIEGWLMAVHNNVNAEIVISGYTLAEWLHDLNMITHNKSIKNEIERLSIVKTKLEMLQPKEMLDNKLFESLLNQI